MSRPVRVVRRHDGQWVAACQPCRAVVATAAHSAVMTAARTHVLLHIAQDVTTPEETPLVDDVLTYLAGGEGLRGAARRHGIEPRSLERQLRRIGRADLVQRLARNDRRVA